MIYISLALTIKHFPFKIKLNKRIILLFLLLFISLFSLDFISKLQFCVLFFVMVCMLWVLCTALSIRSNKPTKPLGFVQLDFGCLNGNI